MAFPLNDIQLPYKALTCKSRIIRARSGTLLFDRDISTSTLRYLTGWTGDPDFSRLKYCVPILFLLIKDNCGTLISSIINGDEGLRSWGSYWSLYYDQRCESTTSSS
jgi:hypothetical protein